jgi:phospholipase/lecithinase/hemolysin
MPSHFSSCFLTRIFTLGLLAGSALLAACGSSTVNEPFKPTRVVIFGDGLSDTTTNAQYTVNGDGSVNNWARQVAASYGVSVVSFAQGNARISTATGAGGVAVTTITAQAAGFSYQAGDLVVMNGGFSDLIAEANTATGGANSTANAAAYGTALGNLVRSMVAAGAKHIAVANIYDLSKAPAAGILTNLATQNSNSRGALVAAFNDALKTNLGSASLTYIGDNVRLLDAEAYLNTVRATPTTYGFVDTSTVACSSNDAANGIGLGTAKVNSKLCTTGTLAQTAYNSYVFADSVYPTPAFHRAWGDNAYAQILARW